MSEKLFFKHNLDHIGRKTNRISFTVKKQWVVIRNQYDENIFEVINIALAVLFLRCCKEVKSIIFNRSLVFLEKFLFPCNLRYVKYLYDIRTWRFHRTFNF